MNMTTNANSNVTTSVTITSPAAGPIPAYFVLTRSQIKRFVQTMDEASTNCLVLHLLVDPASTTSAGRAAMIIEKVL